MTIKLGDQKLEVHDLDFENDHIRLKLKESTT